jgi:adenylate cyclase class IV
MPVNIEWKARARNPEQQRRLAEQLSDRLPEVLEQEDTFFQVPRGRLKLRQFGPHRGELIFYQRSDQVGPRESVYSLVPTNVPIALRDQLAEALGIRAVVRKRRVLYQVGQTRIHFDEVEGLGTFLEVEVVLTAGQSAEEGQRIASQLQQQLQVDDADLLGCAYVDLLTPLPAMPAK